MEYFPQIKHPLLLRLVMSPKFAKYKFVYLQLSAVLRIECHFFKTFLLPRLQCKWGQQMQSQPPANQAFEASLLCRHLHKHFKSETLYCLYSC